MERCNPNGDPVNSNIPRQCFDGRGIITDVCIKRKIRNQLHSAGYNIFVLAQDNLPDGQKSLHDRVKANSGMVAAKKSGDRQLYCDIACKEWIDVRTFGQVFAFKSSDGNVSESVRGPVSIQDAVSLDAVDIVEKNITKSVNSNSASSASGKASDTLGSRFLIDHGAYVFRGSIYPQMAKLTGFTNDDAKAIKDAIINMFKNDASAARPSGSMTLDKLYWWVHNCPNGQYSPAKVFRSLELEPSGEYPYYTANLNALHNLSPEICEGW